MSEKKPVNFTCICCYFNKWKKTINAYNFSDDNFAQHPLWNNNLFQYICQTMCFKNWIASNIVYVKNVFNENGVLKALQEFSDSVPNRSNWLCEYNILRNVIKKKSILFCMKCCFY